MIHSTFQIIVFLLLLMYSPHPSLSTQGDTNVESPTRKDDVGNDSRSDNNKKDLLHVIQPYQGPSKIKTIQAEIRKQRRKESYARNSIDKEARKVSQKLFRQKRQQDPKRREKNLEYNRNYRRQHRERFAELRRKRRLEKIAKEQESKKHQEQNIEIKQNQNLANSVENPFFEVQPHLSTQTIGKSVSDGMRGPYHIPNGDLPPKKRFQKSIK